MKNIAISIETFLHHQSIYLFSSPGSNSTGTMWLVSKYISKSTLHNSGYFVAGVATTTLIGVVVTNSTEPTQRHKALRFGMPESCKTRYYTNFVSHVDYRTKNPLWVLEHIPGTRAPTAVSRKGVHYREDEEIDPRFRALLSHYRGSGYDRGHMSPAANNKNSSTAMKESFQLSNCCPQVGKGFNQDYWARFEQFISGVVRPACTDLYVITGPLYLQRNSEHHPVVLKKKNKANNKSLKEYSMDQITSVEKQPDNVGLAVPTHFYKVILGQVSDDSFVMGAFVMPNQQIHPKTPLTDFQVDVGQLEEVAGISFFPKLKGNKAFNKHVGNVQHVCSLNNCTLPREMFWLENPS